MANDIIRLAMKPSYQNKIKKQYDATVYAGGQSGGADQQPPQVPERISNAAAWQPGTCGPGDGVLRRGWHRRLRLRRTIPQEDNRGAVPRGKLTRFSLLLLCVCVLPIYSGRQVRWTYQPGSHRRKVTQDFSTFLLRCMPLFFSREGFSHSFPSSTVKSNFVY